MGNDEPKRGKDGLVNKGLGRIGNADDLIETLMGAIDKVGAEMVPEILHRFDLKHLAADVAWLVKHHGFMLSWGGELNTLTNKQKRFCDHHLFNLLVEVATADATASHGKSTKLDLLRNIVELCNID